MALHLQQKKASGFISHLSNKHKLRESIGLHCPKGKLPTCYAPVLPLCTAASGSQATPAGAPGAGPLRLQRSARCAAPRLLLVFYLLFSQKVSRFAWDPRCPSH
jgi:hypothetical protein